MQLVVTEGHLSDSVVVAFQIFKASLSCNIPNSNRAFVRCREQPLVLYGSILFVYDIGSHLEHPATMALEQLDLSCRQIIGSNHGINSWYEQPLVPQMQAVNSFPRCHKTTINLAGLYVDSSDDLVPRARKEQIMLLVDDRDIHRVLKFVNSRTCVRFNVPLTHCAILRCTEKLVQLVTQIINLVGVTNKCAPLVVCRICDIWDANESISVPTVDLDITCACKTDSS